MTATEYQVNTKTYRGGGLYLVIGGPDGEIEVDVQVLYDLLRRCGEISISLVGAGLSESREAQLRAMMAHLAAEIPVELHWQAEIPRTTQGKLLQVVEEPEAAAR